MSDERTRQTLARQERAIPGPYLFLGFGKLDEQPVMAKPEALDVPAHETLEAVYREFRRAAPQGRFAIWVGCKLHPKTFRPQEFMALDSQMCDKAFAMPTTPG